MNKLVFIISLFFYSTFFVKGQTTNTPKTKRVGVIGSIDLAYNFRDKVLNPGLGRKGAIGLSITNKEKKFVSFIGGGFKGAKINLYSPTFRLSFINDIQQNYVPINGTSEDSLIGAKMNSSPGGSLWGTYAQYLNAGLIINNKFKPTFIFYVGKEHFLLFDNGFIKYEDPKYNDIRYVSMSTTFYELKVGGAIPFKKWKDQARCLNLSIGYKWVNYEGITFSDTPLSSYTNSALTNKYKSSGKLTLSIALIGWTNW